MKKDINIKTQCFSCGDQAQANFYKSHSDSCCKTGLLTSCKICVGAKYEEYYRNYKDVKYCIFLLCRKYDYPFYHFVADAVITEHNNKNGQSMPFSLYLGKIIPFTKQKKLPNKDFDSGETEYQIEIESEGFEVTDAMRYKWGNNFSPLDYEFLDRRYLEYCRDVNTDIRTTKSLVEEICHIELKIRQAREAKSVDVKTMKDMDDLLQNLLKTAGLDSRSKREMDSLEAIDTYGMRIKQIEEEEPAILKELVPLYTDADNIMKILKKHVFRSLKNLLLGSRDFDISDDNSYGNIDE